MTSAKLPAVTPAQLRRHGLVISLVLALLFGVILPLVRWTPPPAWPFIAAGLVALAALVYPRALGPLYRLWMAIGQVLAWFNTRLILGLVYFVVILPAGLLMRLIGRDPMARKFDSTAETYRVASRSEVPKQMEKPY